VIRFACQICGVKYSYKPHCAGQTVKCLGCQKRMTVPKPEWAEEVLEEVEEEDVPEAALVDVSRPRPKEEPARRERGLIVHGDNGSVELVGTQLVFRHSGGFGIRGIGRRGVRAGTYRHPVVGLTDVEYVAPDLFGMGGKMRFVFGHERRDLDECEVLDTQTVTFGAHASANFLHFKREVERFRRRLIDEIRMNR
jgi:hypothetical protein